MAILTSGRVWLRPKTCMISPIPLLDYCVGVSNWTYAEDVVSVEPKGPSGALSKVVTPSNGGTGTLIVTGEFPDSVRQVMDFCNVDLMVLLGSCSNPMSYSDASRYAIFTNFMLSTTSGSALTSIQPSDIGQISSTIAFTFDTVSLIQYNSEVSAIHNDNGTITNLLPYKNPKPHCNDYRFLYGVAGNSQSYISTIVRPSEVPLNCDNYVTYGNELYCITGNQISYLPLRTLEDGSDEMVNVNGNNAYDAIGKGLEGVLAASSINRGTYNDIYIHKLSSGFEVNAVNVGTSTSTVRAIFQLDNGKYVIYFNDGTITYRGILSSGDLISIIGNSEIFTDGCSVYFTLGGGLYCLEGDQLEIISSFPDIIDYANATSSGQIYLLKDNAINVSFDYGNSFREIVMNVTDMYIIDDIVFYVTNDNVIRSLK